MIQLAVHKSVYELSISAFLINKSKTFTGNLSLIANALQQQAIRVYQTKNETFQLRCNIEITPLYSFSLRQLNTRVAIVISDNIHNNNAAEAYMGASLIKLNTNIIQDILHFRNTRTFPHELGHILGWDHPHANGQFGVHNPHASELEKRIPIAALEKNLMSQTWYIQKSGQTANAGIEIRQEQLDVLKQSILTQRIGCFKKTKWQWGRWVWQYPV